MKLDEKQTIQYTCYVQELIEKYYSSERLTEVSKAIANRHLFDEEYGRGGLELYRGAHCRSMLMELYISNLKRGRIIKSFKKNPDYIFYYKDGIVTLVSKKPSDKNECFEHIRWDNQVESSIVTTRECKIPKVPMICEATVDDKQRIKKNVLLTAFTDSLQNLSNYDLYIEEYFYSDVLTNATLLFITSAGLDKVYLNQVCFDFIYDEENEPIEYVMHFPSDSDTDAAITIPLHIRKMMNKKLI